MTNLLKHIEDSIRARALLRCGERILVAVSGGVDSMVLLHMLHDLAPKHGWKLAIAHFNHQLRGRSSDADARFVERTAKALGLQVEVGRGDVSGLARKQGLSVEMAAREMRHHFFAHSARRLKCSAVALAHHADDQVELFLLRLLRGAGEGLAGMKWIAPLPGNVRSPVFKRPAHHLKAGLQTRLVRPLLDVGKVALEQFARENKIPFREDASNESLDFQRNRIRHELLPLLRKRYQPALDKTVLRVMEIVGGESAFAGEAAERWLRSRRAQSFDRLPAAVQRRCLQLGLFRLGIPPEFELVERLRRSPGKPVSVDSCLSVRRDSAGKLHVIESKPQRASGSRFCQDRARIDLRDAAGQAVFSGNTICFEVTSAKGTSRPRRRKACEFFDADKVGARIVLRHWRAGDRFQPIGMDRPVKLQDLFVNRKIPREARHGLVIATTSRGVIFWVEGLRIGERFKLDNDTRRRLKWAWLHS